MTNANMNTNNNTVIHFDDDATVKTVEIDDDGNEIGIDEESGDTLGTTIRSVSSTSSTPRSIRARSRQNGGRGNGDGNAYEHPMDRYMGCITTRARHQYMLSSPNGSDMGRAVVLINVTNIISLITAMTVFGVYVLRGQHLDREDPHSISNANVNNNGGNHDFDKDRNDEKSWIVRAWIGLLSSLCWSIFGVYGGIFVGRGRRIVGSIMIGITSVWYCCVCAALLYYLMWWLNNAIVTAQFMIFTSLSVVWSGVCVSPHVLFFVALRYKHQREQLLQQAIERRRQNQNYPTAPSRNAVNNAQEGTSSDGDQDSTEGEQQSKFLVLKCCPSWCCVTKGR